MLGTEASFPPREADVPNSRERHIPLALAREGLLLGCPCLFIEGFTEKKRLSRGLAGLLCSCEKIVLGDQKTVSLLLKRNMCRDNDSVS